METIKVGTIYEKQFKVTQEDTALAMGSGGEKVLATPRLVAWMENTAFEGLEKAIDQGKTTVGTEIQIKHLAASPIGMKVTIKGTVISQEKRSVTIELEAWDNIEKIGEAIHQRFIVDRSRFIEKALLKIEKRA
ncbi:thioesterase family protein [Acetobacterium sp.]|uniref:thioesterase family protein n=1 Tax=Acetobacterium sp. TaxID=1872094 RepID=UPI002F428F62